jgi:hypothetical protein
MTTKTHLTAMLASLHASMRRGQCEPVYVSLFDFTSDLRFFGEAVLRTPVRAGLPIGR